MRNSRKFKKIENEEDRPLDTVETLEFINENTFISGSWAGILRIYSINSRGEIKQVKKGIKIGVPIFKTLYLGDYELLVGCGDGSLVGVSLESGKIKTLKKYKSPVIGVYQTEYDRKKLLVIVESWGKVHISTLGDLDKGEVVDFDCAIIDCDLQNGLIGFIFPKSYYYFSDLKKLAMSKNPKLEKCCLELELCFFRIDPKCESVMFVDQVGRANYCLIDGSSSKSLKSKIVYPTSRDKKMGNKLFYSSPTAISYCGIGNRNKSQCVLIANDVKNLTIWNCIKKHQGLNLEAGELQETVTAVCFNDNCSVLVFAIGYCWNLGVSGIDNIKAGPNIFCKKMEEIDFEKND